MPLKQISLGDYEKRIKKFAFKDDKGVDVIKITQLVASFHELHPDIADQLRNCESVLFSMVSHPLFQVDQFNQNNTEEMCSETITGKSSNKVI
jgi:hypothetical protein